MDDELKVKVSAIVDDSAGAKSRFKYSLNTLTKGMSDKDKPKIEVSVSKINGSKAIKEWKSIFKDSVKDITAPNIDLKPLNSQYKNLEKQADAFHKKNLNGIDAEIKKREQASNQFSNQLKSQMEQRQNSNNKLKQLNTYQNSGVIQKDIVNSAIDINKLKTLGQDVSAVRGYYDKAKIAADNFKNALKSGDVESATNAQKAYKEAIDRVKNSLSSVSKSQSKDVAYNKEKQSLHNLILEMQNYAKANDKLKNNRALSSNYNNILSGAKTAFNNKDYASANRLISEFKTLRQNIAETGNEGQKFGTKLKQQFEKLGVYFSASAIMMGTILQIKNMIKSVVDLDKQLVNLQMVTGGTREKTAGLVSMYNEMAKSLGATTVQVTTSANEFLRQGKSIEETNTLIKASMVLSKIGMLNSAESTQYLTASMKGYKVQVQDVMGIVDRVSKVDMVSATSAGGLMEGMSRVANFANDVGFSMDRLLATLATIGEVTQKNMSEVGDGLRTIFARMSNIKLGKLVDDETGENLSNVETALTEVGISLRINETDFRDYGSVLDDVASKWSKFTDVQKNSVATAFAGKVYARSYSNVVMYAG